RQLHVDMFRPADAGTAIRSEAEIHAIMARYSDLAPYIRGMLEGFERLDADFDINVGNYPYCLLPEWSHKIHHDGELTFTISAEGVGALSEPRNKYEHQRSDRLHPPQCSACVFRPRCRGIPAKYAAVYGTDEFQPVSLERLRAMDKAQHHFVLLVEP